MSYPSDTDWDLKPNRVEGGTSYYSQEHVTQAILMDIRKELRRLNTLLGCRNFIDIPVTLRAIRRNTSKRRKKRRPNAVAR